MRPDLETLLISSKQEQKIKSKLPNRMPINPTAQGWSGKQIQKFLTRVLFDLDGSLYSELQSKMIATKDTFAAVFTEIDAIRTQVSNISELLDEEWIAEILTKIAVLEEKVEEIENTGGLVEGLLDENNKIRASLLPSFVFGSMRFVTTWGDTENNTLEHLYTNVIAPYITSNGGSSRGCYVIVTRTMQVSVSNGYSLYMDETEGVSAPLPISSGQITIERGDWLICISDDGKTWGVINNVYRDATIVNKGIVQLAKEEDGINGTSTTLAMTPKATVAVINEMLGDDGKLKSELLPSYILGGMRFVTSISESMTTAEIQQSFEDFIDANGGTMRGCYAIATATLTITISEGHLFVGAEEAEIPVPIYSPLTDTYFYLESSDWIIAVDDNGTTWAVINNTYQSASTSSPGVVKLATEQDGINGTSTTLAMTPKATVAVINEMLGDIDTALSNILGV